MSDYDYYGEDDQDMSDDAEPMEYLSNDEDLLSGDEEIVCTFQSQSNQISTTGFKRFPPFPTFPPAQLRSSVAAATTTTSSSFNYDNDPLNGLINKFGDVHLEEIDRLEEVDFNRDEFPQQYRFLLELSSINDFAIMGHPELHSLLFNKQTTIPDIIEKEVAIMCLYWAQAVLDCGSPLLTNIKLIYADYKVFNSRVDPSKKVCRINFKAEYKESNCDMVRRRFPRKGMIVYIRLEDGTKKQTKIVDASNNKCIFVLRCPLDKAEKTIERFNFKVAKVFEVPQEFTLISMLDSIQGMKSGALNQVIIPRPDFAETHDEYLIRKERTMDEFLDTYEVSSDLTAPQRDALFAICNKEHNQLPFVLFGPPGTGKTFTISETIQTILRMSDRNRVLVCTPSNMAADRVAEQLMLDFGSVLNEKNVLRFRSIGNDFHGRDRRFDKIIACDLDIEQYIVPKSFLQWRVVVSTLGASSHMAKLTTMHNYFSHIIIDEAGQCSEAELWIPLGRLASENTSIVLCGDPKQLGPVITLDISKELQRKFTSPLVRYMELREYQEDTRLCCQLVDCFRCPEALVNIISRIFYDRKLKPMDNHCLDNFDFTHIEQMKPNFPLMFISTYSAEERQPGGYSYRNELEAEICVSYANFFVSQRNIAPEDIGIISPYTFQTKTICDKLNAHKNSKTLRKITVNSVERFQGSERSVIIMTATRTNALGFMADDLRVNTSLTRAKNLLIVIGNADALERHPAWRTFIKYCKTSDALKNWDPIYDPQFEKKKDELEKFKSLCL